MFIIFYLVAGVISAILVSMYDKKQAILSDDFIVRLIQLLVIVISGFYGLIMCLVFYLIKKGKM